MTINIYFPAAAAEQVADEIIKEIQSDNIGVEPQSNREEQADYVFYQWVDKALNVLVKPAYAGANLSVDTVEIRQLTAAMQKRFNSLSRYYSRGLIGIKSDGFLHIRGSVPLRERNTVNKLVVAENNDRRRLYQAIANANGHPEWFAQIQSTFARRWISHAQPGWWHQLSNGSWKQK